MTIEDNQGRPLSSFISQANAQRQAAINAQTSQFNSGLSGLLGGGAGTDTDLLLQRGDAIAWLGRASNPADSWNMFNRWLDIRDSEDELQEFLHKCAKFGDKYKTIETSSVKELELDGYKRFRKR